MAVIQGSGMGGSVQRASQPVYSFSGVPEYSNPWLTSTPKLTYSGGAQSAPSGLLGFLGLRGSDKSAWDLGTVIGETGAVVTSGPPVGRETVPVSTDGKANWLSAMEGLGGVLQGFMGSGGDQAAQPQPVAYRPAGGGGGDMTKTLLIVGGVGLAVYLLASQNGKKGR